MRQGQQNQHKNRMRNRNRKGPNPLTRSYESNGGDVKIRGTALHVAEKYVQLARDAQASGDRVAGENYLQHAEHYYRIVAAAQAQMPQSQQQPIYRNDDGDDEGEAAGAPGGHQANGAAQNGGGRDNAYQGNRQPQQGGGQPVVASSAEQPYVNGSQPNGQDRAPAENGDAIQPVEARGDENQGRPPGGQGNRGGYRNRRRRPYRDNLNGDRGAESVASGPDPLEAGGDPPGDD